MSSYEEQPKSIESVAYNIVGILEDIQRSPDKRMEEFVETYEDTDFLKKKFMLGEINTRQYKKIKSNYKKFCKAYLMKVFLEFIVEDYDIEIMLMLYGFLQGFDDCNKEKRCQRYWEYAHTDNPRIIGKDRKSKCNLFNEIEEPIIKELSEALATIMSNSNWKLNFVQEVYQEFINNKIPEKISPPVTTYLQRNDILKSLDKEIENIIDGGKIFSDTPLFVGQEGKRKISLTNPSPNDGLSFLEITKVKLERKRKERKIRVNCKVVFEINSDALKDEGIDALIKDATDKLRTKIKTYIMAFLILVTCLSIYVYNVFKSDTQPNNDLVMERFQQQDNPDAGELANGDIQNNNRCSDGTFELGF